MRRPAKRIFEALLLLTLILITSHGQPQENSSMDQAPGAKGKIPASAPELAEIIPSATKLASRLASLENKVTSLLDSSEIAEKFLKIEANLETPVRQLQQLKDSKDTRFDRLVVLN